jgi:hypothetical protein
MITYPTTLPQPENTGISGTIDVGLVRTNIPTENASQIITNNSPTTEISMTFNMSNDVWATWFAWVTTNAYRFFNMPVVSSATPTDITSVQRVRFISSIQQQKMGDNWMSATVAAEIVPGDFLL